MKETHVHPLLRFWIGCIEPSMWCARSFVFTPRTYVRFGFVTTPGGLASYNAIECAAPYRTEIHRAPELMSFTFFPVSAFSWLHFLLLAPRSRHFFILFLFSCTPFSFFFIFCSAHPLFLLCLTSRKKSVYIYLYIGFYLCMRVYSYPRKMGNPMNRARPGKSIRETGETLGANMPQIYRNSVFHSFFLFSTLLLDIFFSSQT